MLKYSIAMGIRFICIGLCLVVHGWWLVIFAVGAIALPYFAVVIANARTTTDSPVERPGNLALRDEQAPHDGPQHDSPSYDNPPGDAG